MDHTVWIVKVTLFGELSLKQFCDEIVEDYKRVVAKPKYIVVDETGVGAAAFDYLKDKEIPVRAYRGGHKDAIF